MSEKVVEMISLRELLRTKTTFQPSNIMDHNEYYDRRRNDSLPNRIDFFNSIKDLKLKFNIICSYESAFYLADALEFFFCFVQMD